ncbi:MAG TPA: efflux RND transporter periplasmic adaptor subunit [Candidatus Limnocylindrales bacterium]
MSQIGVGFGAFVALAASVAGVGYTIGKAPESDPPAASIETTFAPVTRGTVTQRLRIGGTYGYDGSYAVVHQGDPGILTATAELGSKVERGGILYRVADSPVRLLYGAIPAYRDFTAGMTDGPDVRQLEQNLQALGMDPLGQVKVDDRFSTATAVAIRRWEASWGVPVAARTGTLRFGRVVFLPSELRIGQLTSSVGTAVTPDRPVLLATSTARVVTAEVTADRQNSVKVGDEVTVTLPGMAPLKGKVLRTGKVATVPNSGDGNEGSQGPQNATVSVVIGVTVPDGSPDLDQAPVQLSIASQTRQNVLMVPVAALLARPGGGYRVRLDTGAYADVEPGLFDESTGKVEVKGGLKDGDRVEVPVS